MNKKILLSFVTIGVVLASVGGATRAVFSDTETSEGNTFSTGTIDISVDGQNPWKVENTYALEDMKPSHTDYIDFVIYNEGSNPVNVWKTLKNYATSDPTTTEPECLAEGGVWNTGDDSDPYCGGDTWNQIDNVHARIRYDMQVKLYKVDPDEAGAEPVWWETIYVDSDDVRLNDLRNEKMYLGMIPVDWYLVVEQSYHMPDTVGNRYQGDQLTFDMELYAEQLTNTVRLENKEDVAYGGGSHTLLGDGIYADLTYKVMDRTFAYEIETNGVASDDWTLFVWEDSGDWPWSNCGNAQVIDTISVSGDNVYSGDVELDASFENAKLWLVRGASTVSELCSWPGQGNILFETGLADYYDADL